MSSRGINSGKQKNPNLQKEAMRMPRVLLLCSALLGAEFAHQSPLSEEACLPLCLPLLSCRPLGSSAQLLICATRNRRGGLPLALPASEYSPETRD